MKKSYSALLLLFFTAAIAQIPVGYYTNATGTGYALKTQLHTIIKGHTDNGYAGLYTIYQTSDRDYYFENDATILDMYSENPTGGDPYNYSAGTSQRCGTYSVEGDCYNREHIIPQSVFNEQSPMVSDAHFITPTDGKVNGQRSNYPHGTVTSPTWTSLNGSKLGPSTTAGYSGPIFEPINEFKGDIARMYFYFATRYENTVAGYTYAMFNGTSNQVFSTAFLNLLITWHNQDPISTREIARNNAIYTAQNNRNPYIDHPEYVQAIWNPTADAQAPTAPINLLATGTTSSSVSLSWTASSDNVGVTGYDVYMNSVLKTTVTGVTTNITGLLASTAYSFYIVAKDAAGNSSASSTVINTTTATGTAITYCTSQGNSTADEKIGKVLFGAINNTTTGSAGYENFTVLSTNVTSGTANTITITPSWTSTVFSEGYAVWIDFNKNGLFTDAGELVWSKTTSTTTPVSGTITIPISAAIGTTRMRVSMKYNAIPTSCESIPYGQVEDYTLNIVAGTADTTAPSAPTTLTASATTPTTTNISWSASTDDVGVTGYEVYRGVTLVGTVSTTAYNVTGLTGSTTYSFAVKAKDAAGNISATSNTLNVTTAAPGGSTATDLLFSEYIEGSSNNKALEISNATNAAINLSIYSIKKQTNGTGSWSAGLSLTGTLNTGTKFTIVNSLIASSCYPISSANLSTAATEMTFNGNDAVGLFKNGVLIDIIGTFNGGTANFAADETIRRKATVTAPTTTFNKTTQWDSYTTDTCNNLGSRMLQKSIKEELNLVLDDITLYPNPTNGTFSITNSNTIYSIEIYSSTGQKVFEEKNCTKSEISVPNIPNGIYMARVTIDSNSVLKKLIIN